MNPVVTVGYTVALADILKAKKFADSVFDLKKSADKVHKSQRQKCVNQSKVQKCIIRKQNIKRSETKNMLSEIWAFLQDFSTQLDLYL